MNRPRVLRNTTKRADRIKAWNEACAAGLHFQPKRLSGRDARYRWLNTIVASDLAAATRLVAHSLAMHGRVNGGNIFPSTRRLSAVSGLSGRSVCTHLDVLVRRGFLNREARHGNTAGARGFTYKLCAPKVLTEGTHSAGPIDARDAISRIGSVLKPLQRSAEAGAVSAEADDR